MCERERVCVCVCVCVCEREGECESFLFIQSFLAHSLACGCKEDDEESLLILSKL